MGCSNSPGGGPPATTTRRSSAASRARRRRPLRRPRRERPPPVPEPTAADKVLRHPLEVPEIVAVPGPEPQSVSELHFDLGDERDQVPAGPRRRSAREDGGE